MEKEALAAVFLQNNETLRNTLARNVAAGRNALNLTQQQLADQAQVSRTTIIQIEAAEGDPRLSTLVNIALVFGLPTAFLLFGKDEILVVAEAPSSQHAQRIRETLTDEDIAKMRRLLGSGINKSQAKAAAIGASAAGLSGVSAASLAGAAIGSRIMPGLGTAIGGAIGAIIAVSKQLKDESGS
ncbi:MAG: helix-turn-helix domain-containing protein [Ferrovum sp.]|jgi:transcriptional regulator with XRE-family HTH domain|uniref:helix-turn-helix transcriptional regulator n=1 Tax=Ferrovum sp. TaxID=2609467 RepID=UPI00260B3CE9|nr:helix-turn-helix transcriptional regulator [Ferrovum sp.]MBW8066338.1 helix-turn-helix domain-containing protein [Ferrovum sp.]